MKGETRISAFPTKRLKYLVTLRRSPVTEDDATLPYIGLENIESGTGRLAGDGGINSENPSLPDEGRKASGIYFERGDVLFGKLRPYLMKSWVAEFPGRCTTEALVMTPHAIEARFLCSVCLSPKFVDTVDASTFGSKMPRAEWSFIGNMPVPVPNWERQRAIADFLDRETERLDALVAAKERLLELLAEKRRAIIYRAAAGRIAYEAPAGNPGVSADGDDSVAISGETSVDPAIHLRRSFSVTSGATPSSGDKSYWEGDILWITPKDMTNRDSYWLTDTRRKITHEGYQASGTTLAPAHSIALSKRSPMGEPAILEKPACSNQSCFLITPKIDCDSRFLYYWLSCHTGYLQSLGSGSTFMELGMDDLKLIRIPDFPVAT